MTPVQVIVVLPEAPDAFDISSNKRVRRPLPDPTPPQRHNQWPLTQQPPDAEVRRHLDDARREIANSRGEIARFLRGPGP